jgi:hypothetical protein
MSSIISVLAPLLGLFKLSHDRGHAETSTLVSKLHHKWMVGFLFASCIIISGTSLIYGPMLCATTDIISETTLNAHCWAQAWKTQYYLKRRLGGIFRIHISVHFLDKHFYFDLEICPEDG